ncbi:uncharacterized protein CANTADRAFT_21278 [Suhomyces tanzawaensis NRRL Y-17324]|uniref:C2H2-type domain-containing protein n=1 Tax=Suhomyces tanzawaensis NRRL Y-17324 TaxID=984487 RepID=A0A1E4SKI9_9ASCO|nr:uncharacterized protein CANTADRAFT_21278 [Suhomyces tanzawaensis NRRL Y-17324]ODV80013.1 hypothetical protein CANTADRAFT_21278 [Suhomyces tanzawaensis NRRL Y-17324]
MASRRAYSRMSMVDQITESMAHNTRTWGRFAAVRLIYCDWCGLSFTSKPRYYIHYQSSHGIELIQREIATEKYDCKDHDSGCDTTYPILTSEDRHSGTLTAQRWCLVACTELER